MPTQMFWPLYVWSSGSLKSRGVQRVLFKTSFVVDWRPCWMGSPLLSQTMERSLASSFLVLRFPFFLLKNINKVNYSVILTYFIIPGASGKSFYEIGNDISKIIYYWSYLKVCCKLRVLRFVCITWQVNVLRTHSLVTMASASQKQIQNVTL